MWFGHSRLCRRCGVPLLWSKDAEIDSDNTSLLPPVRGVFYETEEIGNALSKLEERLGIPLENVLLTAHKRAITIVFQDTLNRLLHRTARKIIPRIFYYRIIQLVRLCGIGDASLKSYRKGRYLEIRVRDPWNERLFPGDILGTWESIDGVEGVISASAEDDSKVYRVEVSTTHDDVYDKRLHPPTGTLLGTQEYPSCPACGAPEDFQAYRWEPKKGLVFEKDTGIRVTHNTVGCINSVLFEIAQELGDEIFDIVTRIEADYVKGKTMAGAYDGAVSTVTEGDSDLERYRRYLGIIRRRCMGNPTMVEKEKNGILRVVIRNPANEELVLGRILGTYEAEEGIAGRIEWNKWHDIMQVKVMPSQPLAPALDS